MKQKNVLSCTGGGGSPLNSISYAFTMAEILLSLTIIGVVAAITLPSLTGNINERTWNTQRKALYARFSQAIALMPSLNGYGVLTEESSSGAGDAVDTAAESFITSGLSKVLKINNICDNEHLSDCGIPEKIVSLNGSILDTPTTMSELNERIIDNSWTGSYSYSQLDTKAAAFETANGESIVLFYNPNCVPYMNETTEYITQPKMCANFIFDMNGNKGPNTVGKDIGFLTVFYPSDSAVVAPNVPVQRASSTATQQQATSICKNQDPEFRIPSLNELSSMFINQKLIYGFIETAGTNYWSSSLVDSTRGWVQGWTTGGHLIRARSQQNRVHCVKRD